MFVAALAAGPLVANAAGQVVWPRLLVQGVVVLFAVVEVVEVGYVAVALMLQQVLLP